MTPPCTSTFVRQHLCQRHPALDRLWHDPSLGDLNDLAQSLRCPVRFCDRPVPDALAYETQICEQGLVSTRVHTWHDRLNAAMWMLWPQSKSAISRAHLKAAKDKPTSTNAPRNRRRDALTLIDEVGVVLVGPTSLHTLHEAHNWTQLFWHARSQWFDTLTPFLLGHGLAEQCLTPYVGLTAKALYLHDTSLAKDPIALDHALAAQIDNPSIFATPRSLLPFPILGVPGWYPGNDRASFYAQTQYFRAKSPRLSAEI